MSNLYPLLLKPEFHERPWGSHDLAPIYPKYQSQNPTGEAWITGDACKVANGPLAGKTLGELCKQHGIALVGKNVARTDRFPLLIKFLFPREKLSVQVHPDDAGAHAVGEPCGKTECWYVLDAEPGAQVALGLKPGVTRAQLAQAIVETRAEQLLNWINLAPGDMIYVDAGTVHAIGPGAVLVETQQNSDTTYRLYDYGRPRELHIEKGLAAVKERTHAGKVQTISQENGNDLLVMSPCFEIRRYARSHSFEGKGHPSCHCLVALSGSGVVESPGLEGVRFSQGEAVVIPAGIRNFRMSGAEDFKILHVTLPQEGAPEPKAELF